MTPQQETALAELHRCRSLLQGFVRDAGPEDYRRQFHPDLSPLGWHLGHCVYTEIHWIGVGLGKSPEGVDALRRLYVPELSVKTERSATLPAHAELCEWAAEALARTAAELERLAEMPQDRHPLLEAGFLFRFLAEHWSQHCETAMYVLAQRRLARDPGSAGAPLPAAPLRTECNTVPGGRHRIGADGAMAPYDNERPFFAAELGTFDIARRPVSNAEFASFIADGGYARPELWSTAGWAWREAAGAVHPEHWRPVPGGWCDAASEDGRALDPDAAVHGINRHEAEAFARWAGARLPHEYEWEAAYRRGCLEGVGDAWEWCANTFHPYPEFRAWPYDGYSVPWFDGRHYTLRGGSRFTQPLVRRASFRNYYEADKRHIHAGLRLVLA